MGMLLPRGPRIGGAAVIAALVAGIMLAPVNDGASAQGIGDSSGHDAGASSEGGEHVYREICQACHMPNAEGGTGAGVIPALAKNEKLADADWMVSTILHGRGGMPAFAEMLSPEQVAGVATYVRGHFGNAWPKPVTVDDVKKLSKTSEE